MLGGLFPSVVACAVVLFAPGSDGGPGAHRRATLFEADGPATTMEVHVVSVDGCDDILTSALEAALPDHIRVGSIDAEKTVHPGSAWCNPASAGPVNESGSSIEFVAQSRGGIGAVTSRDPRAERLLPESMFRRARAAAPPPACSLSLYPLHPPSCPHLFSRWLPTTQH